MLRTSSSNDVRRWASGNCCQIDALVAAVIDGLPLWPYTIEVVERLATVVQIRDALLRQKPILLGSLLQKAIENTHEESHVRPELDLEDDC